MTSKQTIGAKLIARMETCQAVEAPLLLKYTKIACKFPNILALQSLEMATKDVDFCYS